MQKMGFLDIRLQSPPDKEKRTAKRLCLPRIQLFGVCRAVIFGRDDKSLVKLYTARFSVFLFDRI
ncbi:hypothetical protein KIN20_010251 [Parelaphostrongylus tenuis]|uniref:Uncharacterized protein n=1 Tax=Parelaphostrongylus tenuis TaxID=148309 RepID=A0AAD5M7L7_PARTN|nr:hypothetical protein KIN20_010251 [Parelaphostrongylus tenuis]